MKTECCSISKIELGSQRIHAATKRNRRHPYTVELRIRMTPAELDRFRDLPENHKRDLLNLPPMENRLVKPS